MAVVAAYSSSVKVTGTSTAMTGEAVTLSGSNPTKRFLITNAAKRVIDPDTAVVVKDGVSVVPAANYVINYMMGYGTFVAYSPSGTITVDGAYLPTYAIAQCRSASYSVKMAELDVSVFSSSITSQQLKMGQISADGAIELIDTFLVDYNSDVVDTQALQTDFTSRTPKVLEITIGSDTARFWVVFPGLDDSISAKDLFKRSIKWKLAAPLANVTDGLGFSWQ